MRVRITDDPELGRYEIYADDRRAGYTTYRLQGDLIAFDHTEIDERFEGEGLGSDLVRHVLDEARSRGLGVLPFCPFVRSWMERHSDYLDLIPEAQRSRFGIELDDPA